MTRHTITRRRLLAAAAGPGLIAPLLGTHGLAHAAANDTITVLYSKDRLDGPVRLDAAVQSATLTLEDELGRRGLRVLQPSAATYAVLDQGPAVALSFAPDAGFSMLFSATRLTRPMPGSDGKIYGEVLLRARVFVGHTIVLTEEARGSMAAEAGGEGREFAQQRSLELAAQRAGRSMAEAVARRLKAIKPEDIDRMSQLLPAPAPGAVAVAVPTQSAPQGAAPGGSAGPLAPPKRRFALVIAVSDYAPVRAKTRSEVRDLPGVAKDSQALQAGLKALGFAKEDIMVLDDAQATSAAVRQHLAKLVTLVGPDDLVLIAISAHGGPANYAPSGFGMPILSDYSGAPGQDVLDFWQLQSLVSNMPARRTVMVVDTCHAGGATGMLINAVVSAQGVSVQSDTTGPDVERVAQAQASRGGRAFAVLTASRPDEESLEWPGGGGLFTTQLLKALAATKAELPLEALFTQHVQPQVIADAKAQCSKQPGCKPQTPMFAYSGAGNQIRL